MQIKFLGAIAIASLLTLGAVACGSTTAVTPSSVSQEAVDPCAAANPCAAADPCAAANPCAAADPCAGADPCAAANPNATGAQAEVYSYDGLAIRGADPVAYFTEGKAVKGVADYETSWNGATWRFSSAENLAAFQADPEAYAPQYGGYCAWAIKSGSLASVDPDAWTIVDGKLYLNYSADVQKKWQADVPGNIAKGDQNWPAALASGKVSESGKSW